MKRKQFPVEILPSRSGWYRVHYAERDVVERRYYDHETREWKPGAYPNYSADRKAIGVRKDKNNSWSYYSDN